MAERLKATLLIEGQALPADVRLDVFICDHCGGKGRRIVTKGFSLDGEGRLDRHQQEHPCGKCLRSGYVVRLYRSERAA